MSVTVCPRFFFLSLRVCKNNWNSKNLCHLFAVKPLFISLLLEVGMVMLLRVFDFKYFLFLFFLSGRGSFFSSLGEGGSLLSISLMTLSAFSASFVLMVSSAYFTLLLAN